MSCDWIYCLYPPLLVKPPSLIGGFKHGFDFPFHIWNVILPIDELIFFKMVIAPVGNAETFSEISGESYGENGES